jgi:hypothetical protein
VGTTTKVINARILLQVSHKNSLVTIVTKLNRDSPQPTGESFASGSDVNIRNFWVVQTMVLKLMTSRIPPCWISLNISTDWIVISGGHSQTDWLSHKPLFYLLKLKSANNLPCTDRAALSVDAARRPSNVQVTRMSVWRRDVGHPSVTEGRELYGRRLTQIALVKQLFSKETGRSPPPLRCATYLQIIQFLFPHFKQ